MAMPLGVFSQVFRLGALSLMPIVSARGCRFASRDAKAWMGQSRVHKGPDRRPRPTHEMSGEEPEMEDIEDKLQTLLDEESKWQRTVKYHKTKRNMMPSGAPERKLSWDAMEQIRYLKHEQPEEWTVERLAEGFSVTPDVILRVLRSKFAPTPERKAKQDTKIIARLNQKALSAGSGTGQSKVQLPGNNMPAMLPTGSSTGTLVALASQSLMAKVEDSGALVARSSGPLSLPSQVSVSPAVFSKHASVTTRLAEDCATKDNTFEEHVEEEEEESWDGLVFTEKELDELMLTTKSSPVVQVGKDFFDTEGNFLYRI
ncbi:neugrin [Polymixia lowei]